MPKRSSKDTDLNLIAARIVKKATGDEVNEQQSEQDLRREAARILGSIGGKKGGPARAEALSAKRRKEIAKKAAEARWKGHKRGDS